MVTRLCLGLVGLSLAACGGDDPVAREAVETRYLGFQIFEGTDDPAIPFDTVVNYTPARKVTAVAESIVEAIGSVGSRQRRIAVILGPIAFDHTDAEVRQIIIDGFTLARLLGVGVGFHIDDSMFWSKNAAFGVTEREWTDWDGTPSTGMLLEWAHPPARLCLNAPAVRDEVTRRARDVIGAEIAAQVAALGDPTLFAGVIAGWETHVGQDSGTHDRVGYHALANRGFSPAAPPADLRGEMNAIVAEHIALWATGLAHAGVPDARIYTHVAFLSEVGFAELEAQAAVPAGTTYDDIVTFAPSSTRPANAFAPVGRPGFTTYPGAGTFEQIARERAAHDDHGGWASAEGTNLLPGDPGAGTGLTMAQYLGRGFDDGATLMNIFGWGIGAPSQASPFRRVAEQPDSLAAYRGFLTQ